MFKKYLSVFCLVATLCLLGTGYLAAQVRTAGNIAGYVTDDAKEPLPGAVVTAVSALAKRSAVTDANGYFRLPALPPAKYTITVELDQFGKQTQQNIEVNVGAMLTMNFTLVPQKLTEKDIIVTATAPLVETEKTTMDTVITNQILNSLPLLGRDFMSSIKILPGVTDSDYGLSISGGRDTDKNYNIDGTDNVDIIQGEVTGGGSYSLNMNKSFMSFDQEAIQELSVGLGAYSADVGFGSGGLINVITKSGSNQLHGSAYLYARTDSLDTNVSYPYKDYNYGGSLGGPIIKDKLLFFLSINPSYNKTGYDPETIYNYGIPDGLEAKTTGFSSFLKLTYLLSSKHTLNLSANVPFSKTKDYVTLWHSDYFPWEEMKNSGWSLTLNETANFSANLLLDSIVSGGRTVSKTDNDPTAHQGFIYIYDNEGNISAEGTYGANSKFERTKFNWSEKLTYFADDFFGKHTLGAGVEMRYNSSDQQRAYEETITREADGSEEVDSTEAYSLKFHQTYVAGYLADSWSPIKQLTLKPGVRLSRNSYRPKTLVEPRFDFAYDPFGDSKTIIRGGFNLYYERMNSYVQQFENYPLQQVFYYDSEGNLTGDSSEQYRSIEIDPNLKYPKTYEWTIGIDREIFKDFSIQANYVHRKYKDQLFTQIVNLRDPVTLERADPTKGAITWYGNLGFNNYDGLTFTFQKRFSHGYQFLFSYSHQVSKGNSNLFTDFSMIQTVFRDKAMYTNTKQQYEYSGNTSFDKPFDFKFFGSAMLPLKFMLSTVVNYTSGSPYTDYYRSGSVRYVIEPYQGLRTESTWNIDARLEKDFPIKKMTVKLMVEAFNLANKRFITSVDSMVNSSTYGEAYDLSTPRRIQLGARLEW